jgi:hypothetical protein
MRGHPDSPRLWEQRIDRKLRELGLTLITHKPCLYSGFIHGQQVLFMLQMDNFAVAAPSESIANIIFDMIDDRPKHLSSWLSDHDIPNRPTTHRSTKTFMASFINSMGYSDRKIQGEIEKSMKISYCSAIGKLISALRHDYLSLRYCVRHSLCLTVQYTPSCHPVPWCLSYFKVPLGNKG